jgi:putative addiction module CopG family antidote
MSVTLPPEVETLVRQKVESGLYADVDEVLKEAMRLLDEHDRERQWLRSALAEGEKGEAVEYTPELMEEIYQRALENSRAGKSVKDAVKP